MAQREPVSDYIVHIAGLDVRSGDQYRQRCAWCGAILEDVDLSRIAVAIDPDNPDALPAPFPRWAQGALVAVADGGGVKWVVEQGGEHDGPVPPECCANLDDAVTGLIGEV